MSFRLCCNWATIYLVVRRHIWHFQTWIHHSNPNCLPGTLGLHHSHQFHPLLHCLVHPAATRCHWPLQLSKCQYLSIIMHCCCSMMVFFRFRCTYIWNELGWSGSDVITRIKSLPICIFSRCTLKHLTSNFKKSNERKELKISNLYSMIMPTFHLRN